jgi:hypothetical protein
MEDYKLFTRLKKIIDATVKMECAGCHKLVPTIQFYDHLIEQIETEENDEHANLFELEDINSKDYNDLLEVQQ